MKEPISIATNKVLNRHQKRKVKSEYLRNYKRLQRIEDEFIVNLFESKVFSYRTLFMHFNSKFKEELSKIKFNLTKPNLYYFEDMYKPIEKI